MADRRKTINAVLARNAAVGAVTALASGGTIRVFSASGRRLWECQLPSPAFSMPFNGSSSLIEPQRGEILESGRADRFTVLAPSGESLWSGTVGDDAGDQFNLEVDDVDFVQGGTFILSMLAYEAESQGN